MARAPRKSRPTDRVVAWIAPSRGFGSRMPPRNEGAEFDWQISRFDFEALQAAITRLLERMGPQGAAERSRYAPYPTPADLGRNRAGDRHPRQGAGARARG